MIAQIDLFTGEPEPIATKKPARSQKPNTIETERYRYQLEGRKLIVINKRTRQRHEHNLRGFFSTENPMKSLKHKMKLSAGNNGYCLGQFLLGFMKHDEMKQECTQLAEINP